MKRIIITFLLCAIFLCGCGKTEYTHEQFQKDYDEYLALDTVNYIVAKNQKYGVADSISGKIVIPLEYKKIDKITANLVMLFDGREYSILNIETNKSHVFGEFDNTRVYSNNNSVRILSQKGNEYKIFDEGGDLYSSLGSFDNLTLNTQTFDSFLIKRGSLYTMIDEHGTQIANIGRYDAVDPHFNDGIMYVLSNEKKGVVDLKGITIIPAIYDDVYKSYKNDSFVVSKDDKMGAFNENGKQTLKIIYDGLEGQPGCFIVNKDGKYGIVTRSGVTIFDIVYDSISDFSEYNEGFKCSAVKDGQIMELNKNWEE